MNKSVLKTGTAHVVISNKQSQHKLPSGTKMLVRRACTAVLSYEKFLEDAEVGVTFVDDKEIQKLNAEYRNKDISTDVLSFVMMQQGKYDYNEKKEAILGDIVISLETAYKQAEIYNNSIQREVVFLTVHSMFHLLGYNHEEGGLQKRIMREKEEEVLKKLGLQANTGFVKDENRK